jgi:hemerythrin superfamily protein
MAQPKNQDAIEVLKSDHRTVEKLFDKFEDADGKHDKMAIGERICLALKVHAEIEEELFYPALKGKVDDKLVDEALIEHRGAKELVGEIEAMGKVDDMYEATIEVLAEQVTHHIEKEEKVLFPKAKKAGVDLDALGRKLADRKQELTDRLGADLSEKAARAGRAFDRTHPGEARH